MREMKDSGVQWIGDIPAAWSCDRGKYIFQYLQKPVREDDGVITCFRDGEVTLRINRREDGFTMADKEIGYQGIDVGDLVVHGMDGFAGSIGISDSRGKASPVLNVLGTNQNKRFYMYYLRAMAYTNVFLATATGIRVRSCDLKWNKLAEFPYPVPSLEEQHHIASFLDTKCAEIDALTTDIQKEIETLQEYRKSVITEAVTKGLNPDVEMKDSGIEWIGKIPKHWVITKLSNCYETTLGKMVDTPIGTEDKWSNYLCAANIKWSGVDTSINKKMLFSESEKGLYLLQKNDVLIMEGGSVGTTCIYNMEFYPCYIQNSVHRCRPRHGNDPRILYYWMTLVVASGYVDSVCNRATIMHYTKEKLSMTPICVIPYNEQKTIAECLDTKCAEIDSIIADKQKQLENLAEYRKSLIYEYVTGKKEVPTT